ncbi:hypothetical protein TrVE_jg6836 [Triparma verrucosa]|uniref:Uncharacterized protein n=1 Tax=Triparma verrucosa TaxID=1606542 RepID=A0A9W7BHR4_9STRA|nr:hypothetical protein TrVE_jg6836 [Triparma verrucosa]
MAAGMPLRVCDFHSKNQLKHVFDAEQNGEGNSENVDPNAAGGGMMKFARKIKAKLQPLTPTFTGEFTDDYWGVSAGSQVKKSQVQSRTVSPPKDDETDIRRIYKKLVVANGARVKTPRSRTKSPMRLKKSGKKSRAARKAALKNAMLQEQREEKQEKLKKVEAEAEAGTRAEGVEESVRKRLCVWREQAVELFQDSAQKLMPLAERAKAWGKYQAEFAEAHIGTLAQDLQLQQRFLLGGILLGGLLACLVMAFVGVGLASLMMAGGAEIAMDEVASVGTVPDVLLEPVGDALPFDITSVGIQGASTLNWKVEGEALAQQDAVFVSVFVDGVSKYYGSVQPDSGSTLLDMGADLMPLEQGMHSFLLVVTSSGGTPFSRHVTANFVYEAEDTERISLDIVSPVEGDRIPFDDFKGIYFDSFGVPDDALEKGAHVNLFLDNERFKIPFFEGEINLEGLSVGKHSMKMGFVLDEMVWDETGVVEFEIY